MTPLFAVLDTPIIVAIVGLAVLLFGVDRIPKLARSMGEAKKEFEAASRSTPATPDKPPTPPTAPDSTSSPGASTPPPSAPPQ